MRTRFVHKENKNDNKNMYNVIKDSFLVIMNFLIKKIMIWGFLTKKKKSVEGFQQQLYFTSNRLFSELK